MLVIRLARVGKKNQPSYRIVVIEHKRATNAKPKEVIGFYNPLTDPSTVNLKKDRAEYWIKNGARVSTTVSRFVKDLGIDLKDKQIVSKNKPSKKKKKDKEGGEEKKDEKAPEGEKKEEAPKEEKKDEAPKDDKHKEEPKKEEKPKEEKKVDKPPKEEPKKDAKPEDKKEEKPKEEK